MAKNRGSRTVAFRQSTFQSRSGQVPVWLVVLIVVVLVAVGIYLIYQANQRAGTIQVQSEEQITELEQQLRATESRFQLSTLRNNIEAGAEPETLQQQYEDVVAGLEEAYGDAEGEAAEAWDTVQGDLEALGEQIGNSSEEAVATIDSVLERLSASVEENQ